jgi:hypothetical protein
MDKILREYPAHVLPTKLHERTGKAKKKNLFEEIDTGLHQSDTVTFHTSLDRVLPWIKALDYFYYQQLGNRKEVDIKWYDRPETWSDPEDNNTIVIELYENGGEENLLYNVTFFITTGTIRVQGKYHETFVQKHFPLLKKTVEKVVALCNVLDLHEKPMPVVDTNQNIINKLEESRQIQRLKMMQGYCTH